MSDYEPQITLLFVVMALAAWLPSLLPWLAIPAPVLELLLGILIGPHGLHLNQQMADAPMHVAISSGTPVLTALSTLGMAVLFMRVGFEIEPDMVRGRALRLAWWSWFASAALALAISAVLVVLHGFPPAALPWLVLALSTSALGVVQPLLRDRGSLPAGFANTMVSAAVLGEVMPTLLISLVVAQADRLAWQVLMILMFSALCGALLWLVVSHRHRWERLLERTMNSSSQLLIRLAMLLLVVMILIGQMVEINLVLGALVTGVLLRFGIQSRQRQALAERLDGIGGGFLIPLFFIDSGMQLDFSLLLAQPLMVLWIPLLALVMLLVRGLPLLVLHRHSLALRSRLALALDCGTQLPLVVAISMLALQRSVLSAPQATVLVAAAVATVMIYPALSSRLLRVDNPAPRGGLG